MAKLVGLVLLLAALGCDAATEQEQASGLAPSSLVGSWQHRADYGTAIPSTWDDVWTLSANGTLARAINVGGMARASSGSWSLSDPALTIAFDDGSAWSGTATYPFSCDAGDAVCRATCAANCLRLAASTNALDVQLFTRK